MKKTKVGIIGCGAISNAYFNAGKTFKFLDYTKCSDLNKEAAKAKEEAFGCKAVSVDELLADDEIKVILNLTTPQAHAEINIKALNAGKHVYLEKPFALNMQAAEPVIVLAKEKGLRIGCAPDTFLGGGHQACRKLIDDGWIGKPLSGYAFMMSPGHEGWHPAPAFYYLKGGGPLFDMGPYYITALVNMLGPVKKVCSMAGRGFSERICTTEARMGERLPVEVDTHITGSLEFVNGALITMIMSFDTPRSPLTSPLGINGTAASLMVPNPNNFSGEIQIAKARKEFEPVAIPFGYTDPMRSIGLADMVKAIENNREHRASGDLAFHVLEVMCALQKSAEESTFITLKTTCKRPAPLPLGLMDGDID